MNDNAVRHLFAVPTLTNPHHDPRPWQDCTREDVREGDLVEAQSLCPVSSGVAHHQDEDGDWWTEDEQLLTYGDLFPLRRIPAHTDEKETPVPESTIRAEPVNSQAVAPGPRERVTNEIDEWLEIETRKGGYSYLHMGCGHTMNLDPETRSALVASLTVPETITPAEPLARTLLRVPEGHGAPHHDAKKIKPEGFVMQVDKDGGVRGGRAHYQDNSGDWMTKDGDIATWADILADRPDVITVWPTLAPPAVEVEWEPQFGDVIYDVEVDRLHFPKLVFDGTRWCSHGARKESGDLTAFTLPVGIRVRRDGTHPDGTPRFIKANEEEA